jgi:hypothetical protein
MQSKNIVKNKKSFIKNPKKHTINKIKIKIKIKKMSK